MEYDIVGVLSIGLCSLLKEAGIADIAINCCMKAKDSENIYADVVCKSQNIISIFNFEIASGLEKEVTTHSEQLERLSKKIRKSYANEKNNINEFFVVTPHCKSLLPSYKCIISINEILNLITKIK